MILISSFCSLQFYRGYKTLALMQEQVAELKTQIQYMKYEKERLLNLLEKLDSEDYIERIAREELGLVKRGEILIITVEE